VKTQDSICTIRNPNNGAHDLSELRAKQADGWFVTQAISDCQSAMVFIIEKGADGVAPPEP